MIYVTGSLAYDFIMDYPGKFADQIVADKIHLINLSFLVKTLREGRGGTAGNIAYSFSLFKQKSSIIASAGKDFGPYKKFLNENKVETKHIFIDKKEYTARAYITTDLSDNQITGFYPGAMKNDSSLKLPKNISSSDFVVISPTDPIAMENFVDQCIKLKMPFMFDPGMQLPRLSIETLRKGVENADIIIGNDYEIALLERRVLGRTVLSEKGQSFKNREQIWITTLGEKGSEINIKNPHFAKASRGTAKIKIKPVKVKKVVDPTGAGDAYRAGFLAGYLNGLPLKTCGQMGSVSSSFAVEKYGTMEHCYTQKEFEKRYQKHFGLLKR